VKILQVVDGTGWGGTKEQVYLTTRELKKSGIDVHIALNFEYKEMIEKLKPFNIPIHFFEDNKPNGRYRWSNYKRLINIIESNKFDIVVANSPKAMDYVNIAYLFIKNKPKLIAVRRSGRVPSLISKHLKYKKADKIVVVSKQVAEVLKANNFFPDKLVIIESGIDLSRFKPYPEKKLQIREQLNLPKDKKIFINVANWQLQVKAQDKLIESYSKLNCDNCLLILVGLDTDKHTKEYAEKFNIKDKVIGLGFRNDIPDLLNASDYFVLSSNLEGIAGSLLQAMATGKVVLSTLAGGIGEYLKDGYNGFSVPVGDTQGLTKKMERMLNLSEEEYKTISQKAIQTAQNYSIQNTAQKYINLFKELTDG
jgi:glycosyltransferase involved in cell wall biosynthesis